MSVALQKVEQQLAQAKTVKDVFDLEFVEERFVKNYEAATGKKDGQNRYTQERFAYLEIIADKPELQNVDKFYHMSAIVKAGTTGLSFRDGKLYVIPTANGLKVQSSPAGKREQFEMMPDIKKAPEAILVMDGDEFEHDVAEGVVLKHRRTEKSKKNITLENIFASYQRLRYKDGTTVDTVVYHDDLVKAMGKSKMKSDQGLWQTWPGEAAKKTATNRAFRLYHKYPDNVVLYGTDTEDDEVGESAYAHVVVDTPTEKKQQDPQPPAPDEKKEKQEDFRSNVNEETGEVYPTEEVKEKSKKHKGRQDPLPFV